MSKPEVIGIPLSEIQQPDVYIRKKADTSRVNLFIEMVKGGVDALPREEWKWPFPPIVVSKLAKPQEIKYKRDGKTVTRTVNYRIVDGVHRFLTALGTGLPVIASTVVPPLADAAQELAAQYMANRDGVLPITREERDTFIRTMVNVHKVAIAKIAEIVQVSQASVSRIATGKIGLTKEQTSEVRKKAAKGRKRGSKGATVNGYKPADFFMRVKSLGDEAREHRKALAQAITSRDGYWGQCEVLIKLLGAIREVAGK